jgi:flagellar hook-associated protein 3 FlgL
MSAFTVSSQYLANALNLPTMRARSALASAEVEAASGQYADLGLQLGDQSGYELSLRTQSDSLQALTAANSVAATGLDAAQSALGEILKGSQGAMQSLAAWTAGDNSGAILQNLGDNALQSLTASANVSANGQYVFGGINSGVAPMADYFSSPTSSAKAAINAAFQTAFGVAPSDPAAASISASALQTFLSGPFAAQFQGVAWASNWSSASSVNPSQTIAPGQTIDVSTNLNQPGFRQLAEGYAMLSAFGGSGLSQAAKQVVASSAATLIAAGGSAITASAAALGGAQQRIADADASMASQLTILQTQIGTLDNVDANKTATTINALMTQLQTSYQLTARLQQMSLAQYLPNA